MASKSKVKGMKALVEQFRSVTGASVDVGRKLLEICNGNLEMAISMQLDGVVDTPGSSSVSQSSAVESPEDNVRAPIPQKREVLVQDIPVFGPRPRRRGAPGSVFDRFRDFRAETRQQEEMIRGLSNNKGGESAKKRTLEDLFRPPLDIMHKGTLATAREVGQQQGHWLLVNVQDVQEFSCQKLNRDVWSDPAVKRFINQSFVFWQVYHDSEEGQKYCQFYKVVSFPYVSILDPRTGELLASWSKLDSVAFCDLVTKFLRDYPCFDRDGFSPPKKKARKESIIDADEESQLKAAIAASMSETSCKTSQQSSHKKTIYVDSDSEPELLYESGSCQSGSDDESCSYVEGENHRTNNIKKGPESDVDIETLDEIEAVDGHIVVVDNFVAKETESKAVKQKDSLETTLPNENEEIGSTTVILKNHKGNESAGGSTSINHTDGTNNVNDADEKKKSSKENDSEAKIMLRLPDGARKQLNLPGRSTLVDLTTCVKKEGFSSERYELVTNFPRRQLSYMDGDTTLEEAGLVPHDTVFVQER
ncbi:UBX domain-containing protein 7-like [Anneissia japonica]|uniref:UBX domain-containing protein 7-like n=1 Tax=Anneissia japonica TaxID=1529436 RepID=UPI0014256210|nr:UBX domain-containing protein 7-like [Anneissia japonica]